MTKKQKNAIKEEAAKRLKSGRYTVQYEQKLFYEGAEWALRNIAALTDEEEEDEVTHEKFFGENIQRVKDALFGKMERDENSTSITFPANLKPPTHE